MRHRLMWLTLWSAAWAAGSAAPAFAGGYDYPDHGTSALARGGAFVARADDGTAIAHNPAGLTRLRGTHIFLGANILIEDIRYQRRIYPGEKTAAGATVPSDRYPHDPTLRIPEVHNTDKPFPNPLLGVSTDLGLDLFDRIGLRLLAGVHGPHTQKTRTFPRYCKKGTSPCEPTDDPTALPAPQRYDNVSNDVLVVFPSIGVAWRLPFSAVGDLSIGAVFQPTYSSFNYRAVIVGWPTSSGGVALEKPENDVEFQMDVEDVFTPTGVIGVHWAPLSFLEIGASVRIGYTANFSGTVTTDIPDSLQNTFNLKIEPDPGNVDVSLALLWVIRSGVRYVYRDAVGREQFDVELDFVYETNSDVEMFEVTTDIKVTNPPEPVGGPITGLSQPHHWKDNWSLRLGGSYAVHDLWGGGTLIVSLGGMYEASPVPDEWTRLDFTSLERYGFGLGAAFRYPFSFGDVELKLAYSHLFHTPREVAPDGEDRRTGECKASGGQSGCGSSTKAMVPLFADEAQRISDGTYRMAIDIVSIGLSTTFGR